MKGERLLKRTFYVPLVALVAILLLGTAGAYGASSASGGEAFESPTGSWFVELNSSADAFNAKAKAAGLQYTERFRFNKLFKGVAVNADGENAQLLKRIAGVVSVQPVGKITLGPVERAAEPELIHAIAMTGADIAQESGLTGRGIKVGVMDTGIDYHNPALGGCFGAGCRVATGYDFVGDRYNSTGTGGALIPHPDTDPDDCNGHGTHVAGIVGANGKVNDVSLTGVAPGVTFGAYKVFGCEGSTDEAIMIAAAERAIADGMQVLNLSIGDAFAWDTDVIARAMNEASKELIVVISAGNSGANGLYSLSSAGNAQDVIGVASLDNTHLELPLFTATPDGRSFGFIQAAGSPDAPTSGSLPMARTGTPTTLGDGCVNAPAAGSMTGKAVLIRRGSPPAPAPACTFHAKALAAQNAGAAAVVLYNNVPGLVNPTVAGTPAITIPVVAISDVDGVELNNRIAAAEATGGSVTLTWTDNTDIFPNPTAGQPSTFTAWGLTPRLNLKPDVAAPGGFIKSTWPMEQGGFNTISGTSMAAPHVSGAVALYLERHGPTSTLAMREALQNSADPVLAAVISGTPIFWPAHRNGAGIIDIDDAINETVRVSPGKIALGEGTAAQAVQLTLTNSGSSAVTYTLGHDFAAGTSNNTFAPGLVTATIPGVSFSSSNVTVPANGSATVNVTITPNAAAANDRRIYSGYIRLTASGRAPLRVPFAGFTGDYQSIRALAPGACEFPGIFKAGGETTCPGASAPKLTGFTKQAAGATYNVGNRADRPVLLFHMAHQAQRVEIRAVSSSGDFLVAFQDLFERNPTNDLSATGFFTYTWDGKAIFTNDKTDKSNRRGLPSGTYTLKVLVTKALAEANNPAHVEVWESPAMNIVSG